MSDVLLRIKAAAAHFRSSTTDTSANRGIFLRFLIAGAANTLFGFTVYSISLLAGAAVWLALLAGMLSGTLFNFITTGGYAFRRLSLAYFPRFLACYLAVYGLNMLLLDGLTTWTRSYILSQAIVTAPLALLSYFLMSRFVFSDRTLR